MTQAKTKGTDATETGAEVVKAEAGSAAPIEVSEQRLLEFLSAATGVQEVDPAQATLDIVKQILSAESAEAVLTRSEARHALDFVDHPIMVRGGRWQESDYKDGPVSFYALVDCVDDRGESFVLTTGSVSCMAQLWRLGQLGALPMMLTFRKAEHATAAGFFPMWLEAAEPSF